MHTALSILIALATFFGYKPESKVVPNLGSIAVPSAPAGSTLNGGGLVGWWTLNGGDMIKNVKDRSKLGLNGFLYGQSTTTVPGKIGQGLYFDGIDDYIDLGASSALVPNNITVSAWFKTSSLSSGILCVICRRFSYSIYINSTTIVGSVSQAIFDNVIATSPAGYSDNKWHHALFTYNGTSVKLYADGVLVNTANGSGTGVIYDLPSPDSIGRSGDNNDSYFPGSLDDVRIYNRTLTASEITDLYRKGQPSTFERTNPGTGSTLTGGLVGHWSFDGANMINNVTDSSGTGNTGKLTGQSSTTTIPGKIGQALQFDGVDDTVDINNTMLGTQALTICVWIKPTEASAFDFILGNTNTLLGTYTNGNLVFNSDGSTAAQSAANSIIQNAWNHACVTRNTSGTANLYIGGVLSGSADQSSGSPTASAFDTYIGSYIGAANFYTGSIDELRVYNRILSVAEIKNIYNFGLAVSQRTNILAGGTLDDGLVGYWSMNGQDMISNITDRSGLGNNGSLAGQTSTTTAPGKIGQGINLDGTDDSIKVPDSASLDFATTMSLCTWFKVTGALNGFDAWIEKYTNGSANDGYGIFYDSGAFTLKFFVNTYNVDVATVALPSDSNWHHVCGTAGAGVVNIYMDGVAGTSDTYPGTITTNNAILEIGGHTVENTWTPAVFDETRAYNRALSPSEITQLYKLGL